MLPFDIRHPSRDAILYFHRKRRPVTDLEATNLALVNATNVLEQVRHRLPQLKITESTRLFRFCRSKLDRPDYRGRWFQDHRAVTNLDRF